MNSFICRTQPTPYVKKGAGVHIKDNPVFFPSPFSWAEQSLVIGMGTATPRSARRRIALAAAAVRPVFCRNTNHKPVTATLHTDIGQNYSHTSIFVFITISYSNYIHQVPDDSRGTCKKTGKKTA